MPETASGPEAGPAPMFPSSLFAPSPYAPIPQQRAVQPAPMNLSGVILPPGLSVLPMSFYNADVAGSAENPEDGGAGKTDSGRRTA